MTRLCVLCGWTLAPLLCFTHVFRDRRTSRTVSRTHAASRTRAPDPYSPQHRVSNVPMSTSCVSLPPINVRVSEAGMMRSPFRRSSLHVYASVPMAPISHPRHTPSLTWKRMLRRRARTIWDPLWRRPPIPILMDALSRYRCHNAHVGGAVPSIN